MDPPPFPATELPHGPHQPFGPRARVALQRVTVTGGNSSEDRRVRHTDLSNACSRSNVEPWAYGASASAVDLASRHSRQSSRGQPSNQSHGYPLGTPRRTGNQVPAASHEPGQRASRSTPEHRSTGGSPASTRCHKSGFDFGSRRTVQARPGTVCSAPFVAPGATRRSSSRPRRTRPSGRAPWSRTPRASAGRDSRW